MSFAEIRKKILAQEGRMYWRSLEEFADTPEFAEFIKREFPHQAEQWDNSLSRRNFIKLMGASLALAGISGCVIQPPEKIVPYVKQPEEILPGKPLFFATAMTLGGIATGLLAKSNEGRPTKIEGNPEHPGSLGATDVYAQASLLGMYDPDRSQNITYLGSPRTWQNFMTEVRAKVEQLRASGGAGIRFLSETVVSPTLADQMKKLLAELPNARWYQYEPINKDNVFAGAKLAFGTPVQTVYKLDKADRILSLDKDIFSEFNVRYIKDFAKGRAFNDEKKEINRLYVVETTLTLAGAKADHRLAVKPSQMILIAKAIAAALGVSGVNFDASLLDERTNKWIQAMAKDLLAHKGRSVVMVGDNQSPEVHALAHAMNAVLENVGKTVVYIEPFVPNAETLQIDQLRQLIQEIDRGEVKLLVILGGNPVYNTPADLKLSRERLDKVPLRIHVGLYVDETAELCHWHVSEKHYLESWADTRAYDGTVTMVQPLIKPLYDSKSIYEVVQVFFKENYDKTDLDIVKGFWQGQSSQEVDFEKRWRKIIHDGFIENTASQAKAVNLNTAFISQIREPKTSGELEIAILPDPSIYDGRFCNNGWLQELPNPITKVTWENVALVSPRTAERLGLNQGWDPRSRAGGAEGISFINTKGGNLFSDLVKLKANEAEISKPVPVWIQPGQPDDVITIFLGYGRWRAGRVGTGLGYNAYEVRRSDAQYFGFGSLEKTGQQTRVASTQTHFNMEGRDILRIWDVEQYKEHPDMGHQHDEYPKSLYPRYDYSDENAEWKHKWAMTIDLNACVGCNACIIACQAENNIPVVGKEQVERSREMHWMRVDAYYVGEDVNNPQDLAFQPVLCQQCELAPCEVVCPVHATVHSPEGLNDMVYNRCVGTRYCSNNCPYKVRRFNFLLYQDWNTPQYKLMRNPEVTVRSRGVMEKCTYCVQRLSLARIEARKQGRRVRDGEATTACQTVCPADAIVFGDWNDETSLVAKMKKDKRNYILLNELNTQPRTTYLAALKNQNPEMPDYVRPPEIKHKKKADKDEHKH
ncbi:MAG: TAT-variant-translocated molybdopterin oxidoreductase [Pyrinomonadaceae bacterium]|nr:TAT-variant-translocated molybdopterin oxidoreductase [Pyrinomonadaceae bacterium]MCX7639386.1 TAT-variant-translocated molybdopterin oxidoreductase [Pyrinomonadaceae bacterium]MDW8304564.1 TAT-variant-translocated molybdopterin oxidoreductase [Acidobacteriota bacterium]